LLTGGIGAGKSSVGALLRARGALVIDADEVGHQVLEPSGEAYNRVAETWPSVVVDGVIDRRRLADIVFRDRMDLERLEGFTHSAIRQRIAAMIGESSEQVVVVELPLLANFMGKGWRRVVVDAEPDVRTERLIRRDMDENDARQRMDAQPSPGQWLASADLVLDNSGSYEHLVVQVDELWHKLQALAGS
jgi:dephospho-CoA kinase